MNPLQEDPQLFANQNFWIRHGDKNGNYTDYPPFKWGIDGGVCIINDESKGKELIYPMTEQLTLIARPIDDMTAKELEIVSGLNAKDLIEWEKVEEERLKLKRWVNSLINPWLEKKADIDKILRVARKKSINFHDIADSYEKELLEDDLKDFDELEPEELMKRLINHLESGVPEGLVQFMVEQWGEYIQEVEGSKNVRSRIESIDITPSRGASIEQVADEAQAIADQIDKQVFFEHREVKCVAIPGGISTTLIQNYTKLRKDPDSIFGGYAKSEN